MVFLIMGSGAENMKKKEKNTEKKKIEKWKGRKSKNTRKVK